MRENIYSSPSSNLDKGYTFKGNPIKAIAIGLSISVVGSILGAMVVGIAFGVYWASTGMRADEIEILTKTDTSILAAYLIESLLFSFWSGYYVAKKTNFQEFKFCFIMVLIGTILGVLLMVAMPEVYSEQPLWYTVTSFILYPIVVINGCWLFVKSKP